MNAPLVACERIGTGSQVDGLITVSGKIILSEVCHHPEGSMQPGRFIRVWLGPLCGFMPRLVQLTQVQMSPASYHVEFVGVERDASQAQDSVTDAWSKPTKLAVKPPEPAVEPEPWPGEHKRKIRVE